MVSVIASVYNSNETLSAMIKSVISQTYKDIEFIIIDDGSTDDCLAIINKYKKNDKRIIVVSKENSGLTKSLNIGLKMAEGDFIARIDADDIWKRNKLKKQVDFLEENKNYALVGTAYDEIHNNEIHHRGQAHPLAVAHCDIIKVVARFNPFAHSSVVFRANILHVIGYYNEKFKYSQDYEFWVRIMSTYKVANLNEVLVSLGCFGNSISVEKEKAQRVFAIRSKLLAINVLDKSLFEYRHLFNDVLAVVLPKSITNLIRRFKLHSK